VVESGIHLDSVIMTNNVAASGGAMSVLDVLQCRNSIISSNSAQSQGGAIAAGSSSHLTISDSVCSNNTSGGNGGCFYSTGRLDCDNCTVTDNTAVLNGGAIHTDFSTFSATFNASLLTNNTAQQSGGAWFGIISKQQAFVSGSNTQIFHNKAGCCYASGYGSTLQNSGGGTTTNSTTCSDTDTDIAYYNASYVITIPKTDTRSMNTILYRCVYIEVYCT
jgi:predicted outer membrane repeat protein